MNDRNYPNFTRLLSRLGVATQPTHMSFSVKAEDEDFEYSGTPGGLFCQPRNLVSARFQRMIVDLLRFNRALARLLADEPDSDESLSAFLSRHRFSRAVRGPADRPAGLGGVVCRPARDEHVPGPLPGGVLRQPRDARLPRPPAVVDDRRRLGPLRRGADGARSASGSGCARPVEPDRADARTRCSCAPPARSLSALTT